jgi:hypothetical protein
VSLSVLALLVAALPTRIHSGLLPDHNIPNLDQRFDSGIDTDLLVIAETVNGVDR